MNKIAFLAAVPLAVMLGSCASTGDSPLKPALDSINADSLMTEIKALSSDEFEGRKPGSPGEQMTISYLEQEFRRMGLGPGNQNEHSYLQKVPLAGITSKPRTDITVNGKTLQLSYKTDYIALSSRFAGHVDVKASDIVFVGYGVVAPEYGWDDYKGVDVKGKTILMLVNDPAIPDPNDPTKLDDKMFKGKAMTYYGRWTYKYEIASEKGAAAAIIIHETGPAGYPFEVVSGSWGGENFGIQKPDNNMSRVAVEGWMTFDKASELCKMAGQDLAALKKAAITRDFKPVPLAGAKASFSIENTIRKTESHNVVAYLAGSDPKLKDQYVIYTAHWDHLGKDPEAKGDQIFNGARDNASGTAGLLEIARGFSKMNPRPKRTIVFIALTAEEQGLLGSEYYAENPLYPLKNTLADINMDELNVWGKAKDVTIVGLGNSTLDDTITDVLKAHGRTVRPDPKPEVGGFYRSDHFEFAKVGLPALDPETGIDMVDKPEGTGKKLVDQYDENDYHKPSDEIKPFWNLSGAVEDLQVFLETGYKVAQGDTFPTWKPGTEFKAKRDEMMK